MKGRKISLGGAALNSARASAHCLRKDTKLGKITYIGSIGNDDIGRTVA